MVGACAALAVTDAAWAQSPAGEADDAFPRCEMSSRSRERFNALYGEARLAQIEGAHLDATVKLQRAAKLCVEAELFLALSRSYEALGEGDRALAYMRAYQQQLAARARLARAEQGDTGLADAEVARLARASRRAEPARSGSSKSIWMEPGAPAKTAGARRPARLDLDGPERAPRGSSADPARPPTPLFLKKTRPKRLRLSTSKSAEETRARLEDRFSPDAAPDASYTFVTSPAGAELVVDGEVAGVTPHVVALSPGEHVVEVRKQGWRTLRRAVEVRAGEPTRLFWSMTRAPEGAR